MPKQVLIINITRMGDLIQMVPLLSRLEEESPGVAIDLIVDKEFAHVAALLPGIRQVLVYDFQLLMDESRVRARDIVALYRDLARWIHPLLQVGYDRVVNLTFNRRSAFLTKCLGCQDERGMTTAQDGNVLVKNSWMKYFVDFHLYRQLNRFNIVDLFALGGSGPGNFHPIRLAVPRAMQEWGRAYLNKSGSPEVWVAIQVGASDPMKAWRPEYFGRVMASLSQKRHVGFVLIGTNKEEVAVKEAIRCYRQAGGSGILCEAVGHTTVPQLVALLEICQLMVTNDTGPMHLAVGVKTPVLNVSVGHVDFWETGPFGPGHWVVQPDIVCGPCGFDKVCPHHACKDQIISHEVAELCLHLLGIRSFPEISSKVRIYEGVVNEDRLGSFLIRAGSEEPGRAWYAEYWRRYWYESFTGLSSRVPVASSVPPDLSEYEQMWCDLAPQLDQLCLQADRILELCRQRPIPVEALKTCQQQLTDQTCRMQQVARPLMAFGPLAMAFLRDTFSLEAATVVGMAEENARAFHVFRTRAVENHAQLEKMFSHDPRRALYASATG
jgi:ADP-heptose:LPS heptosyltransferase